MIIKKCWSHTYAKKNDHYIFSVFLQDDPVATRVSQRIADATGLSMETAESLLVRWKKGTWSCTGPQAANVFFTVSCVLKITWTYIAHYLNKANKESSNFTGNIHLLTLSVAKEWHTVTFRGLIFIIKQIHLIYHTWVLSVSALNMYFPCDIMEF